MDGSTSIVGPLEDALASPDLNMHESGLSLLQNAHPETIHPPIARTHISEALITWMVDDSQIYQYAKDKVLAASKKSRKHGHGDSVSGGQAFFHAKYRLIAQYARPWLELLWDFDKTAYSDMIFDILTRIATEKLLPSSMLRVSQEFDENDIEERTVAFADEVLKLFGKLMQTDVLFDTFQQFISRWFDEIFQTWNGLSRANKEPLVFKSLARLFETDTGGILNYYADSAEKNHSHIYDAWELLNTSYIRDVHSLSVIVQRLCIIAQSGVPIPLERVEVIVSKVTALQAVPDVAYDLSRLLFAISCSKYTDRTFFSSIILTMIEAYALHFSEIVGSEDDDFVAESVSTLTTVLATMLLTIETDSTLLLSCGFFCKEDISFLHTSRRKRLSNEISKSDIEIPSPIIEALAKIVQGKWLSARTLVTRFLYCLFIQLNPASITKLVTNNAKTLSTCVYRFFGPGQSYLAPLRSEVLLCVLAHAPNTFKRLIKLMCKMESWENRYMNLDILYSILFEAITSNHKYAQASQHLTSVIISFFGFIWDENEYVRAKSDVLISSFQTAHLNRFGKCLETRLRFADVPDKLEIAAFASRIQVRLPSWQVFSWNSLLSVLREVYDTIMSEPEKNMLSRENPGWQVYITLTTLSLGFIAEGVAIDQQQLLELKSYVVFALGFRTTEVDDRFRTHAKPIVIIEPPKSEVILAIFGALKQALDSHHKITWHKPHDQGVFHPLVGSIFVDSVIDFFNKFESIDRLQVLHLQAILDCLAIIIYKHNFDDGTLFLPSTSDTVAAAMQRTTALLTSSYVVIENKLLIIDSARTFLTRYPTLALNILSHQMLSCAEMLAQCLVDQVDAVDDEYLFTQGKLFLRDACCIFATNGILGLLFKIGRGANLPGNKHFFDILETVFDSNLTFESADGLKSVKDETLLDVLVTISNSRREPLPEIITALPLYVTKTHKGPYSQRLIRKIETSLLALTKTINEWRPKNININPILEFCVIMMERGSMHATFKEHVREFFKQSLCRFSVSENVLSHLVEVLNSQSESNTDILQFNQMVRGLASELLSRRLHMLPDSIITTLSYFTSILGISDENETERTKVQPFRIAEDAQSLMQTIGTKEFQNMDMNLLVCLGRLFLQCITKDENTWSLLFKFDRMSALRTSNLLLFASLKETSTECAASVVEKMDVAAELVVSNLMYLHHPTAALNESTNIDPIQTDCLTQAFLNIRLNFLIARMVKNNDKNTCNRFSMLESTYWRAIWPAFERALLGHMFNGKVTPGSTIAWGYFCDLIKFFFQIQTPLTTTYNSQWTHMIQTFTWESSPIKTKVHETLNSLMNEATFCVTYENAIQITFEELFAAFKYRAYIKTFGGNNYIPVH